MKFNMLKTLRIIWAILFFVPPALFFCDFADVFPDSFSRVLRIQLIPAILAGNLWVLVALTVITVLFGRIYCAVICPLGILQDLISRLAKRGKKNNRKKRWYHYKEPYSIVRYSLLGICAVFLILGITTPLALLDPYSNFGRIAVNLFRPAVMEGNNFINWIALKFNNYDFYHVTIYTVTTASFSIAAIALLTIGMMSFLRGRLFCNTICPAGSLLGLLSRYSVFRVVMDEARCTRCGLCERACKSQCINSKEKTVDSSRCVACFNCLDRCNKKGIGYRFAYSLKKNESANRNATTVKQGINRRSFILASGAIATTLPFVPVWAKSGKAVDVTKLTPVTPPGSQSLKYFKEHCTACHLCVTHCPQQILKPAGFNFGINYVFKPHMVFYEMAYCNYECTVCSEICPNGAIKRLTPEEKQVTQVGIVQFTIDRCVVYTENTSCGACSEHCPVKAVRMEPYTGALTIPHIYPELCIGCGGCESICPVRPVKAINVLANEVHQTAVKPEEEAIKEIDPEELDFGF
jgi:ferredoxin